MVSPWLTGGRSVGLLDGRVNHQARLRVYVRTSCRVVVQAGVDVFLCVILCMY